MSTEKIEVFYQSLLVGYHETLVYTDANGQQFIATAGPTQNPGNNSYTFSQAADAASNGTSSVYGNLGTTVASISSFSQNDIDRMLGITGNPNPSEVVATGTDLSQQWNAIVYAEQQIANQGLPYSPLTQNSNSVASSALTAAGISPPTDNGIGSNHWAPASDNFLYTTPPTSTPILAQLTPLLDAIDAMRKGYYDNGTQCVPPDEHFLATLQGLFHQAEATRSPLVLDLNGDGVSTVAMSAGVHFDQNNNRFAELSGWVAPSDGLLVRDLNGNGQIDGGVVYKQWLGLILTA